MRLIFLLRLKKELNAYSLWISLLVMLLINVVKNKCFIFLFSFEITKTVEQGSSKKSFVD